MPKKTYIVELTSEERSQFKRIINIGRTAAYKQRHARILLLADQGPKATAMKDDDIAKAIGCGRVTVERVRKSFIEEGLQEALERHKSHRQYRRKLDGKGEAHLITLACSQPPEGQKRWTLRLLADRMVALEYFDSLS
jgi:transposase